MSSLVHSFTLAQRLEPAEVWQLIISQVPVQDLLVSLYNIRSHQTSCRMVSRRWKEFIDAVMNLQSTLSQLLVQHVSVKVPLTVRPSNRDV